MSKRAYVFNDYVWAGEHYIPPGGPRTPLNAILSGPSDPLPRSISERWFDVVCPPEERRLIVSADIKPPLADLPGAEVFAAWETLLRDAPARCIEIVSVLYEVDKMPQVFDLWIWGNSRVLSLGVRPLDLGQLACPVAVAVVLAVPHLQAPRRIPDRVRRRQEEHVPVQPARATAARSAVRLGAAHARDPPEAGRLHPALPQPRGVGEQLLQLGELPQVMDQFTPLPGDDPTRVETMMGHCLPDNAQIIKKLYDVREDCINDSTSLGRVLDVLYLLTNEQGPWHDELRVSMKGAGWNTIVTSRDLLLDMEQEEVGMAVDMELARRAAVFIGNGWSSFTSNIIHQRLVDGREPLSIRST
ncbi:hypothetical protein B0H14DRAFT_3786372 [Mycena olivaceomarginata]|nr:hypothetical protein B0H14DRAFT_3786372 [Mycena olivaceomarginata]